jgi:hypothetical protein
MLVLIGTSQTQTLGIDLHYSLFTFEPTYSLLMYTNHASHNKKQNFVILLIGIDDKQTVTSW